MTNEINLLNEICGDADMGQTGIAQVIDGAEDPQLRQAMERQQKGYYDMYQTAGRMLKDRGRQPKEAPTAAKAMSGVTASLKTMVDHSSSKIAEMMIQGSTMGITKLTRALHDYGEANDEVKALAEKLVRAEQANVEEMKKFL